ncbi:LuxR C-terminal-related transcriptional regulator [Psychroflexus aestuariivivens]|uniref:LuxR C-terminal-related transcriptional regulator n=1 Tax=Psychroflexus aestuariivivens TaxID=1795040 RepID=UPI000FDB558F|nr:LuxR C-terminal-related transcriptional regulator [Psychroflexus aestuariivivens]
MKNCETKGSFWEVTFKRKTRFHYCNIYEYYKIRLRFTILAICFVNTFQLLSQESPAYYINQEGANSESLKHASELWKDKYELSKLCEDFANYETLAAYSKIKLGQKPEFKSKCGDTMWYFAKGISEYINHNFKSAFESFKTAEAKAKSKIFKIKQLENMGASQQMLNNLDAALNYYNKAYELSESKNSNLLRVNIASLHAEQENYKDALFHSTAVLNHPEATDYEKTLSRYNILSSATLMDSLDLASVQFNKIDKDNLPPGSEWSSLKILLKYVLSQDDKSWFELLVKKHQEIIEKEGEIQSGGINFLLAKSIINNNDAERDVLWIAAQQKFENEAYKYEKSALDQGLEHQFEEAVAQRRILSLSLWILSSVIVISFLSYWFYNYIQNRKRQQKLTSIQESLSKDKSIQIIQDSLKKSNSGLKPIEALLRLDRELKAFRNEKSSQFPINQLNRREAEVFHLILASKSTQEISDTLNLSNKYIYNIRSRIKEIFKIPSKMSIESWIESQNDKK